MKVLYYFFMVLLFMVSCSDATENKDISTEFSELSERLNPTQVFEINPEKDTTIIGTKGTRVFIPAKSLVSDSGELGSPSVNVTLKEFYTFSEMILNGLSTTSNGELLKTSGMIKIEASSRGKMLDLKKGSSIKIQFKNTASAPFMRTYLGQRDSTGMNWQLDEDNIDDTIKYNQQIEWIIGLDYGADTVLSGTATYGVVGNDTLELFRTEWEMDSAGFIREPLFYEIHSTKLNWINCDHFLGSKDLIAVKANKHSKVKTLNYLVFHDLHAIMSSWETMGKDAVFINIPRNSKVSAIGIAKEGSNYYLAAKKLILKEGNQRIKLKYKKSSLEKIVSKLEELE
ncbi:MAG: hypothetical protein R8G66_31245 [Cytophagales bacterium]|nr:hypothetical protein [Cytophagales bacterium]